MGWKPSQPNGTAGQVRHLENLLCAGDCTAATEAKIGRVDGGSRSADPNIGPRQRSTSFRVRRRIRRGASSVRDRWELRTDPTYRQLARRFELPDGCQRVYCHHVRKTAGTSLFLSFMALGGEDPMDVWRRITDSRLQRTISGGYSFASNDRKVLAEGAYFFGRSHRPFDDQPLPPRTFTVTILRDPIERVRSYFDYLVAGDDRGAPAWVANRERLLAVDGFDAFLERVPGRGLLTQLAMFSDRLDVAEAAERIAGCSCVFFTEDFGAELARLGRRLGVPLSTHRARAAGRPSPLTDTQRERLRSRLEPEYELLRLLEEGGVARIGSIETERREP